VKRSTATAFALTPFSERRLIAAADGDVRAFLRERERDRKTHAAVAAGDQY
jgi:hypothetical protein